MTGETLSINKNYIAHYFEEVSYKIKRRAVGITEFP